MNVIIRDSQAHRRSDLHIRGAQHRVKFKRWPLLLFIATKDPIVFNIAVRLSQTCS